MVALEKEKEGRGSDEEQEEGMRTQYAGAIPSEKMADVDQKFIRNQFSIQYGYSNVCEFIITERENNMESISRVVKIFGRYKKKGSPSGNVSRKP
ncbi:hypothetical protein M0802_005673 [Mischocyttarus mexicanus]|nr:hypothetical protein M0802_005673 [Mischocyttarus mexicanus]